MDKEIKIATVINEAEVEHMGALASIKEITDISYKANMQQLFKLREDLRVAIKNYNSSCPQTPINCG